MLLIILLIFVQKSTAYNITVFGDVYKDREFFQGTFPWIIDNIGGEIGVEFWMQGSGRYTVPQMCALRELTQNTFLQAQYLKCEAEGNDSEYCLCETGIDPDVFRSCVATSGYLASDATSRFSQVGVDVTPLIELGPRSTVFNVEDSWFLKKICTIFGDFPPRGCVRPFSCDGPQVMNAKRAITQFSKSCGKGCYCGVTTPSEPTTTYPRTASYDYTYGS